METYRTDVVVKEDGTVTISGLPFHKGEKLDVILLQRAGRASRVETYPLRGEPVKYIEPFEGVDKDSWEASN